MFVKIRKNESVEHLIQRFKKKVALEGLQRELQKRRYYQKPSQMKQEAIKEKWRKIKKAKYDNK